MRKWMWFWVAVGVVATGCFYTAVVKYCVSHPDSALSRSLDTMCEYAFRFTPLGHVNSAPPCCEAGLPDAVPADPAGEDDDKDAKPVVQLELPAEPMALPIIIREDDAKEVVAPEADEPPVVFGGQPIDWEAIEQVTARFMPYCEEDESFVPMPSADEECHPPFMPYADDDCPKATGCLKFKVVLPMSCVPSWEAEFGGDGDAAAVQKECPHTCTLWTKFINALQGCGCSDETEPQESTQPTQETAPVNPHKDQCPRCPYCPGRGYNSGSSKQSEPGTEESNSQDVLKKIPLLNRLFGGRDDMDWQRMTPRIDTMEYRKSDRCLNEYNGRRAF
jgi:hypothetical protein